MRLISAVFLVTVVSACAEPDRFEVPNAPSDTDVLTKALTREAGQDLQGAGQFETNVVEARGIPQLTESEALSLATTFGRTYAGHARKAYERDHGGPIAFERLAPCGRTFYAASPYENVQAGAPIHVRNLLGARWLVTLCDNGAPKLSVAIAASAADLAIDGKLIRFPREFGNEFFAVGIPSNWESALPIGPETAAVTAYRALGRPVGKPSLVLMDFGWSPQSAQWRVPTYDENGTPGADVLIGLRLDGRAAVGEDAVIVQRLSGDGRDAAITRLADHPVFPHVRVRGGSQLGFMTRLTPLGTED